MREAEREERVRGSDLFMSERALVFYEKVVFFIDRGEGGRERKRQ